MKTIKAHIQWLLLVLFVPVLSACDQEDDVLEIFTGKTWYMTYISVEGQHKMYDFWQGDAAAREKSMKTVVGDNYHVVFEGANVNGVIRGTFTGRATNASISGEWSADGNSRKLTLTVKKAGNDADKYLGKAFIEGLKNAKMYGGDNSNLYIYYDEGQTRKFISFAPQRYSNQ